MILEKVQKAHSWIIKKGKDPRTNKFGASSLFLNTIHYSNLNKQIDIKSFVNPHEYSECISDYDVFFPIEKSKFSFGFVYVLNSMKNMPYKAFFLKDFNFFIIALKSESKDGSIAVKKFIPEHSDSLNITILIEGKEVMCCFIRIINKKYISTEIGLSERYGVRHDGHLYQSAFLHDYKTSKQYKLNEFNKSFFMQMNHVSRLESWLYECPFV